VLLTGLGTTSPLQRLDGRPDAAPRRVRLRVRFTGRHPRSLISIAPTHLVILGANPYASNGSVCTAPDFPGRIEAMRQRGGKLVVVDPRLSRTAEEADRMGVDQARLRRDLPRC
jgi:hypothetical protein